MEKPPMPDRRSFWPAALDRAVAAHEEQMVRIRRHLHAYPEPSGEELQTTRYLAEELAGAGLEVRTGPGDRGLIADLNADAETPRLALRADIDALRITDAKTTPYASRVSGIMHACGHDAHAAVVAGAVLALAAAARAGELPWGVAVRAIFQPAEETNQGALAMIGAGALRGVGAILGVHADPSRPAGTIGVRPGIVTADCDEVQIEITGRGGHASRPHEPLDPIAAAAQLITSLYLFIPRAIDSQDPAVVTIGQIHGGENYNVIPDRVELRGTMRTLGAVVRSRATDHIRQLARGLAQVSGARIDVRFLAGPPSVFNDPALTELLATVAADLLGLAHVHPIARPSMGGEDFAHYLAHVPGSMFRLGCAPAGAPAGAAPPLHSPRFDVDERALPLGAKVLARAAVAWADPARHYHPATITPAEATRP